MPSHVEFGVIIANELLDNLPFRLAVFDGGWREVVVIRGRGQELAEGTVPCNAEWSSWLPAGVPHGTRLPVQDQAAACVSNMLQVLDEGSVLAFDYCTPTTAALVGQPWRDWLRTYRSHGRGEHYLRNCGGQDITAQVCLDQLPSPLSVETQAEFLGRFGIDELVEEGRRAWSAGAARPDLTTMAMRSRIREAEALLDRQGLGSFDVVRWRSSPDIRTLSGFLNGGHRQ
jgi:SAM-dependent MidA family methyltransferase